VCVCVRVCVCVCVCVCVRVCVNGVGGVGDKNKIERTPLSTRDAVP
jgi:hypothetical protein